MHPLISQKSMQQWQDLTLIPARKGVEGDYQNLAILSADTDKIKEYVFESNRLPEIRGASRLLDGLNRGDQDLPQNTLSILSEYGLSTEGNNSSVIYAAGGSLLALVPETLDGIAVAKELQQQIEALYPTITDVATITCVWQSVHNSAQLHQMFRSLMDSQTILLQQRKQEREQMPFVEALPYERRCTSCGTRPAVHFRSYPNAMWLCNACEKKAKVSGKQRWATAFEKALSVNQKQQYLHDKATPEAARDLHEIAGSRKTIGLIYADGDNVGKLIESSASLLEYHKKSQLLIELLSKLVFDALAKHLTARMVKRNDETILIHPFEIVTIGGDDLLLIVPGNVALSIAMDIGTGFAKQLGEQIVRWEEVQGWKRPETMPTLSAGVVIADENNPVRFVRNLAEQLLKRAKQKARQSAKNSDEVDGAIDFLIMKSQSMLANDISELRRMVYEIPLTRPQSSSTQDRISLTGRPYLWRDFQKLLSHAHLMRNASYPQSQFQAFRRVLRETKQLGPLWPTLWYYRQKMRGGEKRIELLQKIEQEWEMINGQPGNLLVPWLPTKDRQNVKYYTIWEDLYEVWSMLPALGSNADENDKESK